MAALVPRDISRTWDFKKDLNNLSKKLEALKAVQAYAETQRSVPRSVENWLMELQATLMDVEDVLDEFDYEILKREIEQRNAIGKKVRSFLVHTFNSLNFRFQMSLKIKDTTATLERISQESERLGFNNKTEVDLTKLEIKERREQAPACFDLEIIGREREVSEIRGELISPYRENELSVVGIFGMGGIGKTTLAKHVFQSDKIVEYFDDRMWVTVPDYFETEYLLEEMLRSLNPTYHEVSKGEAIMQKLQNCLNGRRFLLVLDDVWNDDREKWDRTEQCFLGIGASRGSKILVTARTAKVWSAMTASSICYLSLLSTDDSWNLFARLAFADDLKVENPELVDIGKRLVERCQGLPLAIKVLAGLLYLRKSKHEWSMIEGSETWYSRGEPFSVLELSYDALPSFSVKQCFVYCSIFPKNTLIEREKIIQQWMAQGFLNSARECHLEMEDIGNSYFDILLQACFFQDVDKDDYGNTRSCKMHDIVHDFALHIAKNFGLTEDIHLSFISKEGSSRNIPKGKSHKLRTLYFVNGVLDDMLTNLISLRVLVVESFEVRELPASIGNLRRLRYLDISRTMIRRLPHSITKLHNLQTLRLYALEEFPKKFCNLINLRHLYIEIILDDLTKYSFLGIRQLVSLQTLPFFVVSGEMGFQIDDLACLPNLKGNLKIFGLQNIKNQEEAIKANLSKKSSIQSLEFHWDDVADGVIDMDILDGLKPHYNLKGLTILNFPDSKFPSWMVDGGLSQFHNLVHFRLENCNKCHEIPMIGHLPYLNTVKIYCMHDVKIIGTSFYGWEHLENTISIGDKPIAFPSLKRLNLSGMSNLVEWCRMGHSSTQILCPNMEELYIEGCPALTCLPRMNTFGSLRWLVISSCDKLACLPEGIGSLGSLEYLGISKCPNLYFIPDAQALKSLRVLFVLDCNKLRALPNNLEQCTLLENLSILSCPAIQPEGLRCSGGLIKFEIGYFSDELDYFPWPYKVDGVGFTSLTSIKLYGWPKLLSLPEQLQYLSALRDLTICMFDGLEVLPEWLCDVRSLEILELQECRKLMRFPSSEAMRCLIKLQSLKILYCPLLQDRCLEGSRPEWHKITHVPLIYIDNRKILSQ